MLEAEREEQERLDTTGEPPASRRSGPRRSQRPPLRRANDASASGRRARRKDRLRSTRSAPTRNQRRRRDRRRPSGWFVPPERAAAFEPAVPVAPAPSTTSAARLSGLRPARRHRSSSWVVTQPPPPPPAPPPPPPPVRPFWRRHHRGSAVCRRRQCRHATGLRTDSAETGYGQIPSGQPGSATRTPASLRSRPRVPISSSRRTHHGATTFPWKLAAIGIVVLVGGIGAAVLCLPGSKPAESVSENDRPVHRHSSCTDRRRARNDRRNHHLDAAGRHSGPSRRQARGRVADDAEGCARRADTS